MRAVATVFSLVLLAGCAREEAPPPPPPPASPALADFAGTWQLSTVLGTDTVPSTMTGSADGSTWTLSLEGRPNIAMTASIAGDSLIGQTAEYESVLRPGVMVSVRTASVLNAGALQGTVTATYRTASGSEVVNGTFTGSKTM